MSEENTSLFASTPWKNVGVDANWVRFSAHWGFECCVFIFKYEIEHTPYDAMRF